MKVSLLNSKGEITVVEGVDYIVFDAGVIVGAITHEGSGIRQYIEKNTGPIEVTQTENRISIK